MTTHCRLCHSFTHGPLARYVKLRVGHAPGMLGTFSSPPWVSDPDMHHGTCVTHVSWCMSGSLTSGFLWSRWRGKRSRHSRRMRNPQFHVSGKRPIRIVNDWNSLPVHVISAPNMNDMNAFENHYRYFFLHVSNLQISLFGLLQKFGIL